MSGDDFEFVRDLVRRRSAIALGADRAYLADARLAELAHREGLASAEALMGRVRADPRGDLARKVVEVMATHETSFFRDGRLFEALRLDVIPALIGRRAAERHLRIWCGACASGQEPYSLAILLREHFSFLGAWSVSILATDLSAEMIDRSRSGLYSPVEVARGMPPPLLARHFRRHLDGWEVVPEVRRMVDFRIMNLIDPWPPSPPLDLVLLRNVLIYFGDEDKRAVLRNLSRRLQPDGYLALGGCESTHGLDGSYERVESARWGFHRLRSRGAEHGRPRAAGSALASP